MATPTIDQRFIEAGHEFSRKLDELGLDTQAVLWAYDNTEHRFVLLVVTDFFDQKGPLEISRQLFKAYNAALLPKEIDPFVVRTHSVNHLLSDRLIESANVNWGDYIGHQPPDVVIKLEDLDLRGEWMIKGVNYHKRQSNYILRRWERFKSNIDRLAA